MISFVTVANYDWDNNQKYIPLAALWMQRLRKYHKDCILWWGVKDNPTNPLILRLLRQYDVKLFKIFPTTDRDGVHHNLVWKLGLLCQFPVPYFFIDLDAVAMSDLSPLWKNINKDFSASNHQVIEGHTDKYNDFMNSGVLIVKNPDILDENRMVSFLRENYDFNSMKIPIPGADQALLHCYFKHIGYEWRDSYFTHKWNSWSGMGKVRWGFSDWEAIDDFNNEEIKVLHYWHSAKPWAIDCPMYDLAKRGLSLWF